MAWIGPIGFSHEMILVMRLITLLFALNGCRKYQVMKSGFFWVTCIYSAMMLVSVFLFDRTLNHLLKTFSYTLVPVTIYLFTTHRDIRERFSDAMLLGTVGFFSIDAFLAFFTAGGTGLNPEGQPLYFVGGKFQICYIYILLMLLCFLKFRQRRRMKILLTLFGLFTAFYVDCNTGAIGILITGMMMFLPERLFEGKKIYWWFFGAILINYLVVFVQVQLTNPLIGALIEKVLHRNLTLTGRMNIYNNVADIMRGHWLLGYGYTSDYILEYMSGHWMGEITNMQNGFLQILYTSGIIGLLLYFVTLLILLKKLTEIGNMEDQLAVLAVFIAFFVIAIVEIPLSSGAFHIVTGLVLILSGTEDAEESKE